MIYALVLSLVASKIKINRKLLHLVSLVAGGFGFILIYFISEPWMLHLCFSLVGIAWASILSMPYAMLSGSVEPKKMGVYMGIFNMFIVIPQIVAALGGVNFLYKLIFGEAVINTMLLAGTLLILAGLSNLLITDRKATHD
jgi:maltose/moltooligosaccharide transporter